MSTNGNEAPPAYDPQYATSNIEEEQPVPSAPTQQVVIQQPIQQQPVVYVDQYGNPVNPPQQQQVVIQQPVQQPAPGAIQLQIQQPPVQQQPVVYVDQYGNPVNAPQQMMLQQQMVLNQQQPMVVAPGAGGAGEGEKTETNEDELPPNYESIIDGSYDRSINGDPKDGVGCMEGCRQSGHMKSWALSIIVASLIFITIILSVSGSYVWFMPLPAAAFFWIMYSVEWLCCASSMKYLNNILSKDFVYDDIKRLHTVIPVIQWNIECYHYKRYRDSKGRSKKKKVVTHRAKMNYTFRTVCDRSVELTGLEEWQLTKLTVYKTFSFANEQTKSDYQIKRHQFKKNNDRDRYQKFTYVMHLKGFRPKILVEATPGTRSKYLSSNCYTLFSCFLCSPCYRTVFSSKTGKKHYIIQKQISI